MHVWIWVSNQYLENLEWKLGNYNDDADFGFFYVELKRSLPND